MGDALTVFALVYPVGALLLASLQWRKVFRLYRDWSGRGLVAMLHAAIAVRRQVVLVGAWVILIVLAFAISVAFKVAGGAIAVLGLGALGFFALTQVVLPPGVLFLGSSSSRAALGFADRLGNLLAGYRPVYFLDVKLRHWRPRNHTLFISNSYYSQSSSNWRQRVREVAEAVPLIVCDGRGASPAVKEEIEFLFRHHALAAKTYFVNNVPRLPPFLAATPDAGRAYLWVSEADVEMLLPHNLAFGGPRRLPPGFPRAPQSRWRQW